MARSQDTSKRSTNPKPWLDLSGRALPLAALQSISKDWSDEIWEEYLETVEGGQSEFMPSQDLAQFSPAQDPVEEEKAFDFSAPVVRLAMAELPSLHRAVIESLLLGRVSQRDTADLYGLTRWKVRSIHKRTIEFLRSKISPRSRNN